MVKFYSYKNEGNVYVSPHTQVKEMVSKSGNRIYSDTVLIDDKLLDAIEALFSKLNCKKYIISSGYRTPEHDKAVGGNGVGQHTLGKAVDACFYDKSGRIISAKVVCCAAQDIGLFAGIANISGNYAYVHLDVRDSGKYKGDEIYGNHTVTDDFYKYFSLSKSDVAKYTGEAVVTEPKSNCFAKYTGVGNSIVTALNSLGVTSTYAYRSKIASANGICGYCGTAAQNLKMLNLLKNGALIKP